MTDTSEEGGKIREGGGERKSRKKEGRRSGGARGSKRGRGRKRKDEE